MALYVIRRPPDTMSERNLSVRWYAADEECARWVPCLHCAYRFERGMAHEYAHGTQRMINLECQPVRVKKKGRG